MVDFRGLDLVLIDGLTVRHMHAPALTVLFGNSVVVWLPWPQWE